LRHIFTGSRKHNCTIEAIGLETAEGIAAERGEPFFDETASETVTYRLCDHWSPGLSPLDGHFSVRGAPRHQDAAQRSRKCSIFRSVGCEFMKNERQGHSKFRGHFSGGTLKHRARRIERRQLAT
jgi:hypothetical protein